MQRLVDRVNALIEALPYIRDFFGKTLVIKYGGSAMLNEELKNDFAQDVVLLRYVGMNPVIVHGGGPLITEMLQKLNIKTEFIDGHRVTDKTTMDVVEMVLVGQINKKVVTLINQHGGRAVGMSGKDGLLIRAQKHSWKRGNQGHGVSLDQNKDLGFVGLVESISADLIHVLDKHNFIPVISPIGADSRGETYNINADTVASEIAAALRAEKLVLLSDVPGVVSQEGNLFHTLGREEVQELISQKIITGGMLPKVHCCLQALEKGVKKTHIIDGRVPHALLLEIFTNEGIGTEIIC
ncbi:MAG: acetylglutamate kinase [bacterium]